jgi:hypothetical protein
MRFAMTALNKLIENAGWLPIEEATKDGTKFYAIVGGEQRKVMWGKTSHIPLYGWILIDQGDEDAALCEPTHFMPLDTPERMAAVIKVLVEALERYAQPKMIVPNGVASNALARAEAIAGGSHES